MRKQESWQPVPNRPDLFVSFVNNRTRLSDKNGKRIYREVWVEIPRFKGLYSASSFGYIRNNNTGKIVKSSLHRGTGYHRICLYMPNGEQKTFSPHRLILEAFLGPDPRQTDHRNGKGADNRLANLRYQTTSENLLGRKFTHRLMPTEVQKIISLRKERNLTTLQIAQLMGLPTTRPVRRILNSKEPVDVAV